MTKISADEKATREALRPNTQRKATKLMNLILVEQNAAAARGDHAQFRYFQEQIKAVAESSTAADYQAVDRAVIAWNKLQEEKLSEAEKAIEAKKPIADPKAILDKARRIKANGQKELDRLERERIAKLKGE